MQCNISENCSSREKCDFVRVVTGLLHDQEYNFKVSEVWNGTDRNHVLSGLMTTRILASILGAC